MTVNELIAELQSLDEETKKKTVSLLIKDNATTLLTEISYVQFTDFVQLSDL